MKTPVTHLTRQARHEFEMDAIAACFIGGTAVTGGIGTIPGAMVGGFAGDASGDDLPPFDVPGATPAPKPAATAPKEEDAPAAPWESNPGAGSPFGHQGAAPSIPQTEDEAKALIRSVFGQATIFKPVE